MKGGQDEETLVMVKRPTAVQGLSDGFGIEILQIEDGKWRRLADFERVR